MRYQQNFEDREIEVIVLGQQQWPHVRPHIQRVVNAVNSATRGSFAEVDIVAFSIRVRFASIGGLPRRFGANEKRLTSVKLQATVVDENSQLCAQGPETALLRG
jgi:hypothetical protein